MRRDPDQRPGRMPDPGRPVTPVASPHEIDMPLRTAVIFRYELLHPSETFIGAQAAALKSFRPCYAGIQHAPNSLPIPEDSVLLMQSYTIPEKIERLIFSNTGWAPRFSRRLQERAPALMHAHFAVDGAMALPLVAKLGVPLVVSMHGYDITSSATSLAKTTFGRLYLKRKEKLLRTATLFICVSEFIRQQAIEAGFPKSKLRVHYIGVDRTFFVPSARAHQSNVVLFVGRLVEHKGCRHLIAAMESVQRECRQAELVIIGDGPQRASLEAFAQQKGISCRFLGVQSSKAVRDWLRQARVFCVPSVTAANGAREGLGMVFAEAQAMGVPVVSFELGGIPEVVRHGETGLLAPEGDNETLAQYLLRYLTDEEFWQASSRRAIQWIEHRFDLHRQTGELENIYREAVGTEITQPPAVSHKAPSGGCN